MQLFKLTYSLVLLCLFFSSLVYGQGSGEHSSPAIGNATPASLYANEQLASKRSGSGLLIALRKYGSPHVDEWGNYDSVRLVYNGKQQLLETINADEVANFIYLRSRIVRDYGQNDELLFNTTLRPTSNGWDHNFRTVYEYDDDYNEVLRLRQNWVDEEWVNTYQSVMEYDDKQQLISKIGQSWFSNDQAPINEEKYIYEYDDQQRQVSKLIQYWESPGWGDRIRNLYAYDAQDQLISDTEQHWLNNTWVNYSRKVYEYNAQQQRTLYLEQGWANDDWQTALRENLEYNSEYLLTRTLLQARDIRDTGDFENFYQNDYEYDEQDNETQNLRLSWKNDEWVNDLKIVSTYDDDNNLIQKLFEDWRNSRWNYQGEVNYYYGLLSHVENPAVQSIPMEVYPNPSRDQLIVKLGKSPVEEGQMKVFHASGQLMASQSIKEGNTRKYLDVSDWPTGSYVVQIILGNQQISQLVLIE